jgi:hypothetical protein
MDHLNEELLIKYQFDLLESPQKAEIAEHLEQCAACRDALKQLERSFSALDLMDGQEVASEELIARTVAGLNDVKSNSKKKIYRFRYFRIAAVVMMAVGVVLIMQTINPPDKGPRNYDSDSSQRSAQDESSHANEERFAFRSMDSEDEVTAKEGVEFKKSKGEQIVALGEKSDSLPAAMADISGSSFVADAGRVRGGMEADAIGALDSRARGNDGLRDKGQLAGGDVNPSLTVGARLEEDELFDKPPFAPASAIELNVLPRREDLQLTIYNSADLTLVREKRHLTLKKGWNWLQFMWANTLIDPTSLHLEPLEDQDKVSIEQLVYPPRLKELGRWLIRSEVEGQVPFELTYFTSGLSWRAFYMGTLTPDETKMTLSGYVRVANASGEDYSEARTRLLVGKVNLLDEIAQLAHRQQAFLRPDQDGRDRNSWGRMDNKNEGNYLYSDSLMLGDKLDSLERDDLQQKTVTKEGLSEYFLYTIEGRETIPNRWGKRLPSFETEDVPVKSLFKFDTERWGDQTMRFVSFANDPEHELGETPIPDGTIKLFHQVDERQHLSYVGGSSFKYIPVGEEVELPMGAAQLVEVKPTLMEKRTENILFDDDGDIVGWDEVYHWKIEVANARMLPVEIEITRGFETTYWEIEDWGGRSTQQSAHSNQMVGSAHPTVEFEKHDATHARFELTVPPRMKQTIDYTIRTYHGKRQEAYDD